MLSPAGQQQVPCLHVLEYWAQYLSSAAGTLRWAYMLACMHLLVFFKLSCFVRYSLISTIALKTVAIYGRSRLMQLNPAEHFATCYVMALSNNIFLMAIHRFPAGSQPLEFVDRLPWSDVVKPDSIFLARSYMQVGMAVLPSFKTGKASNLASCCRVQ